MKKDKTRIKKNITGKIHKDNINYGMEERKNLPHLFPALQTISPLVYGIKQNREKYDTFPDELPTNDGEMPYPPDDHEMIGEFEYPHNTYLLMAHAYNNLMAKVKELEDRVSDLESV